MGHLACTRMQILPFTPMIGNGLQFVHEGTTGLDFRKKSLGPAGSQVLKFGRQHIFFGHQKFSALRAKKFYLKFPQYKLSTPPSLIALILITLPRFLQREGKVKMENHM